MSLSTSRPQSTLSATGSKLVAPIVTQYFKQAKTVAHFAALIVLACAASQQAQAGRVIVVNSAGGGSDNYSQTYDSLSGYHLDYIAGSGSVTTSGTAAGLNSILLTGSDSFVVSITQQNWFDNTSVSADLATGQIKISQSSGGCYTRANDGSRYCYGGTNNGAQMSENVTFHNTTGSPQVVGITLEINANGTLDPVGGTFGWITDFAFGGGLRWIGQACNAPNANTQCGYEPAHNGWNTYSLEYSGNYGVIYHLSIVVQPGDTAIPVQSYINGRMTSHGGTIDFTQAVAVTLPAGVAMTSESGVFLTQSPAGKVTVNTSPQQGLTFNSSGTGCNPGSGYTAPATLTWALSDPTGAANACTLSVGTPQAGGAGTQYVFNHWEDNSTNPTRTLTPDALPAAYTATFAPQYLLTANASPSTGGTVTGGGVYYSSGMLATVTATANSGSTFVNWTGPVANPNSASTTVTMIGPQTVTANFLSSQLINFPQPSDTPITAGSVTLTATATSGLAVSYASTTPVTCSVSGSSVTLLAAGPCTIHATQGGNSSFLAATPVDRTFNITSTSTTATTAANAQVTYSTAAQNVILSATVTSVAGTVNSGAVTFSLFGTTLSGTVVNGGASATFPVPAGKTAGSYPIAAAYGANGNFAASSDTTKNLTIAQATPVITWTNPANIVSGTALGATQLNATATVLGSFVYTPVSGTVLATGNNQTLSVSFTPADATNYTPAIASVLINVTAPAASPTTTATANAQVTFSPNSQNVQLSANVNSTGGTVNAGTVTFSVLGSTMSANVAAGAASVSFPIPAGKAAGMYPISAMYNGSVNFAGSSDTTKQLSIGKATPVINWSNPAPIAAGTALGATQLNATASVTGSFAYTPASGTVLAAGNNQALSVVFTPTDTTDYTTATASVSINVTGTPKVQLSPSSLPFNSQIVGTTSSPQSFTIKNTGSAALAITSISLSGDYSQTNNCPASLAVNAICTVTVTFAPTATGARNGQVTIVDAVGPNMVSLTGIGLTGNPRINVQLAGSGTQAAGVTYADLKFVNTGTGVARNVMVPQLFVGGLLSPTKLDAATHLPLVVGTLAPGASQTVRIFIDTEAKLILITENGQFQNAASNTEAFSSLQIIGLPLF